MICSNWNMVFVNYIYDMVVDTQFHKFYGRPVARVLYLFLMKNIGRWLPWVLPGSTGRFYKDDVVHNHSVHGYYITRLEGGVRYAWYHCHMLNRIKQNWAKTAIHIIRELDLVTFHTKDCLSDKASKSMYVYDDFKSQNLQVRGTPCKCCSRSQQRSRPGLRLGLTPRLVLIERVWWISHFLITSSALDILRSIWQSTFPTLVVEEVAGPRDIGRAPYFQAVSCNSSSSVFLNHYRTLRTKQRRGSKASGF